MPSPQKPMPAWATPCFISLTFTNIGSIFRGPLKITGTKTATIQSWYYLLESRPAVQVKKKARKRQYHPSDDGSDQGRKRPTVSHN
ncbi:hypothetical protein N7537_000864 [Penicillium hordei]|uniref:Uncharacterized protein n=1 Tax=Penicillium hordei TaxID=40994 RepID=A0AAD6H7R9_9EURO|nr:uncharacterized protein N7537_000864 [Penicillium hordei]KAJ5615750.1 hypothetical protein N7537_000864 [Penicillium hordei]